MQAGFETRALCVCGKWIGPSCREGVMLIWLRRITEFICRSKEPSQLATPPLTLQMTKPKYSREPKMSGLYTTYKEISKKGNSRNLSLTAVIAFIQPVFHFSVFFVYTDKWISGKTFLMVIGCHYYGLVYVTGCTNKAAPWIHIKRCCGVGQWAVRTKLRHSDPLVTRFSFHWFIPFFECASQTGIPFVRWVWGVFKLPVAQAVSLFWQSV